FGNAANLVQHRPRLHHRGPVLRFSLALTHAGFERDRRNGLVWEHAYIKPALVAQILLRSDTTRLDGSRTDPTALRRLQTEVAKDHAVAAQCVTSYTPSLAFSVLDSLGHQRHRASPDLRSTCLGGPKPARRCGLARSWPR